MIKPFHELRHEEFKWLCAEGDTWDEIAKDFPGPDWCLEKHMAVDSLGCWSLTTFKNGRSLVNKDFCKKCELYCC